MESSNTKNFDKTFILDYLHSFLRKRNVYKYIFNLILTIISLMVIGSFIRSNIDGYERAMFEDMIKGTAHKPFVYRSFVPFVIKNVSLIFPDKFIDQINKWGEVHINFLSENSNKIYLFHLLLAIGIWFFSVIGFAVFIKKMAAHFFILDDPILYIISIISVAGIPVFFKHYSYIYDLTHLFLFTLCLFLMVKKKWIAYLFAFIFLTFNKETSILLVFIFFINYQKILSRSDFTKLILIQLLIFFLIKISLNIYFTNNHGSVVEFQLLHNFRLAPYTVSQFLAFIVIGLSISYDWKNKPIFLKKSLVIIVPLVVLTFFLGYLDEYRDYYEIYPIVLLLMLHTVILIFRGKLTTTNT